MNLGQHWRTEGVGEVGYAIEVPLAALAEVMEREHAGYVRDSIDHPLDDPYERAQRERGWPSVPEMLEDPGLLRMSVEWYAGDLLVAWLGDAGPDASPGFVINTVRFERRTGDAVVVAGRARRADRPVRYQDA
jgi:hypothetical protein